jgi:opacity protein-like surface antigen
MRLLKVSMMVLFMILFADMAQAQLIFGVQGGIGASAFEKTTKAATAVPVGVFIGTNALPLFDLAVEYNRYVVPFKFDLQDPLYGKGTMEHNQSYIGAFIRYYVLPLPVLEPYIRAGVGYYSGNQKFEYTVPKYTVKHDFKSKLGFNAGVGVKTMVGIYGEFVYHIFSSKLDVANAENARLNNWMISVGYQFEL